MLHLDDAAADLDRRWRRGVTLIAAFGFVPVTAPPPPITSAYVDPSGPAVETVGKHLTIWNRSDIEPPCRRLRAS